MTFGIMTTYTKHHLAPVLQIHIHTRKTTNSLSIYWVKGSLSVIVDNKLITWSALKSEKVFQLDKCLNNTTVLIPTFANKQELITE